MDVKYPDIEVQLTGRDGNAFAILGAVQKALRKEGIDAAPFMADAMDGDYQHLLRVVQEWVMVR